MKFLASVKLSEHMYKDNSGYLICQDAVLSRTGPQQYRMSELFGTDDDTIVDVYRDEADVFDEKAMTSFENKPICDEHPSVDVNPNNYNELAVGNIRDIHRGIDDGQPVMMGTLVVTNADAIDAIENGKRQLSCGYDCDIIKDENGRYRQINIRGNHLALCEEGRAGIARIKDSKVNDAFTEENLEEAIYKNGEHFIQIKMLGKTDVMVDIFYYSKEYGKDYAMKNKRFSYGDILGMLNSHDYKKVNSYKDSVNDGYFSELQSGEYKRGTFRVMKRSSFENAMKRGVLSAEEGMIYTSLDEARKVAKELGIDYVVVNLPLSRIVDGMTFEEIKRQNQYVDENLEKMCKAKLQNLQKKLQSAKTMYLNYGQTHGKDKEYQRLYDEYSTYFDAVAAIEMYLDDMRITRKLNTVTRITKESYDMAKEAIKLADSAHDSLTRQERQLCDYILENAYNGHEDAYSLLEKMRGYYSEYSNLAYRKANDVLKYFEGELEMMLDSKSKDAETTSRSKTIDDLIADEEEAIAQYQNAMETASEKDKAVYAHIINEELEHIEELKALKQLQDSKEMMNDSIDVNDAYWGPNNNILSKEDAINELRTARIVDGDYWDAGDTKRGYYVQIQAPGQDTHEDIMKYPRVSAKHSSKAWGRIWKDSNMIFSAEGELNVVRSKMLQFLRTFRDSVNDEAFIPKYAIGSKFEFEYVNKDDILSFLGLARKYTAKDIVKSTCLCKSTLTNYYKESGSYGDIFAGFDVYLTMSVTLTNGQVVSRNDKFISSCDYKDLDNYFNGNILIFGNKVKVLRKSLIRNTKEVVLSSAYSYDSKDSINDADFLERIKQEQEQQLSKWGKKEADIWRQTDWKARNYQPLLVASNSFNKDVKVVGSDEVLKNVKFVLEISPNPVFPPRYVPDGQYTKYKNYCWVAGHGTKKNGYMVLDWAETWEHYNKYGGGSWHDSKLSKVMKIVKMLSKKGDK